MLARFCEGDFIVQVQRNQPTHLALPSARREFGEEITVEPAPSLID
jgi:hypothetical protein